MARRRRKPQSFNRFIGGKIKHGVERDQRRARARRGEPKAAPFSMVDRVDRKRGRTTPLTPARNVPRLQRKAAAGRSARADYRAGKPVKTGAGKLQVKTAGGKPRTVSREQYRAAIREALASARNRRRYLPDYADDKLKPATNAKNREAAGLDLDSLSAAAERSWFPESLPGLKLLKAPGEAAKATIEDPRQAAKANAAFLRDAVLGLPGGVVGIAKDPKAGAKAIAKDYSDFYGPLIEGDEAKFRENVKEEGALRVAADVPLPAAAVGKAAGAAAKAGALGKKAKRVVTEERPRLRYGYGESATRKQRDETDKALPNLPRAAMQKRRDSKRAERHEQRVQAARRQAREGPTRTERLLGTKRTMPALVPRGGAQGGREVVAGRRRTEFLQGRSAASRKGKAVNEIKRIQGEEIGAARKALKPLSKWETRAWAYAHRGLVSANDPKRAVRQLERRAEQIRKSRGKHEPSIFERDELKLIAKLIEHADEAFTPRVMAAAEKTGAVERRVAADNPALHPTQAELRRHAQQARLLGVERVKGETHADFLARVRTAAEKEGLPAPSYMPSEELFQNRFSHYAAGGQKAAPDYKRYSGATHAAGKEFLSPEVFIQGLARGIKTKVNWKLVADLFDEHAHSELRDLPVHELKRKLHRKGLDPSEYAIWLPDRYRAQARKRGDDDGPDREGADEHTSEGVLEAINESTFDLDDARLERYAKTKATMVPKAVLEEVASGAKGQGPGMRSLDVLRSKFSRTILGGFNLPWVQAGFAASVFVMALRGATPVSLLKGAAWYRKLPAADKRLLDEELGLEQSRLQDYYKPRMGAAANGRLANTWRSFRRTPLGQRARPFERSINAFLRFERKLNSDAFRKALFHVEAKRTAFREIDRSAGIANGAKARIASLFTIKGPEKQLRATIREREAIETHAQAVSDMLGDWESFTGFERRYLGKMFFYPYMRYSLRWTFYTMPAQHPVMTQLLANLGNLNADEIREVLGGDALPFQLGKVYFTKDGKVREIDLSNIDPAGNAVTELQGSEGVLGLWPPYVQMALGQILKTNTYYNRPWRVEGKTEFDHPKGVDPWTRMRVALNELITASPIGRELFRQTAKGFQGDDALPFSPRPTEYTSAEKREQVRKLIESQSQGGLLGQLLRHQAPFVPRDSRDPELAEAFRKKERERKRKKRGGGGGGGWDKLGGGGGGDGRRTGDKVLDAWSGL